MPLFNNNPEPAAPEHKFLSGDITGFMSEMQSSKQNTGVSEDAGIDEIEAQNIPEDDENDDYQEIRTPKKVANVAGSSLTLFADTLIPLLLALLLKGDADEYRCTPEEKPLLEQAFADYAQLQGVEMPPWLVLFGTIASIYGFKAYNGIKQRKQDEAHEAEVKTMSIHKTEPDEMEVNNDAN